MRTFFSFAMIYFLFATASALLLANGSTDAMARSLRFLVGSFSYDPLTTLPIAFCLVFVFRRHGDLRVLKDTLLAFVGLAFFQSGFMMMKTSMPSVSEFWADPMLASLDRALHFGVDPWELTHALNPWISVHVADIVYLQVWVVFALFFPLIITILDRDFPKRNGYLVLYVIAWAFCGNVLALPFLSGGPIYYEALHGLNDFDGLHQSLQTAGLAETTTGSVQKLLLHYNQNGLDTMGPGISAFPSVHVAVTAVIAFYVHDTFRHPLASIIGFGFLATILFLSVWLGWHYAVDGYASIAVIALARYVFVLRPGRLGTRESDHSDAPLPGATAVASLGRPALQND